MLNQIYKLNQNINDVYSQIKMNNFMLPVFIIAVIAMCLVVILFNREKSKMKIFMTFIMIIFGLSFWFGCTNSINKENNKISQFISNNYGKQEKEVINKYPTTLIFSITKRGKMDEAPKYDSYYVFLNDKQTNELFSQMSFNSLCPLRTNDINYIIYPSAFNNTKFNKDFLIAKSNKPYKYDFMSCIDPFSPSYKDSYKRINKLSKINNFCLNNHIYVGKEGSQMHNVRVVATNKLFCNQEDNYQTNKMDKVLKNVINNNKTQKQISFK